MAREGVSPDVLRLLEDVGLALTAMLGKSCEVLIHDVTDLEHSIVWIEGDVTGRKVGSMMTGLGLERLKKGETHPLFNYTTYTESGKVLKGCSIWLRDPDGEINGAFCINLDVTHVMMLRGFLNDLAPDTPNLEISESHPQGLNDLVDNLIAEFEYRLGKLAKDTTKDERVEIVRFLEEKGAFQVRNSVTVVADRLGVTRKTIYNYLREIARDRAETTIDD